MRGFLTEVLQPTPMNLKNARQLPRPSLASALLLAMAASPLALAQTSTSTTGNNTWSSGSGWSSVPASGNNTVLTFGNGASLAASAAVISHNDIASPPFKLNALNMTYAGPASGTAPTVTIQGNQLEFTNNSTASAPTMVFNTTGTVKPTVEIKNNILFTNTTAINATTDAILSGVLSGTGGFTKSGAGTLRVTNAATSSGGTALGSIGVSAGTLQIGNNGGFGSLGNGTITLSGSGSFAVARASNSFNLANTITGSTSGAVTFNLNNTSGAFAVTLTKANTYTAATNLQPFSNTSVGTPTLKNGIADALSTTTAFSINTVSGSTANMTYDLNGFDQTIASLASGAGVTSTNGIVTNSGAAKTLTISNASGSTTYNGTISGAIALAKSGASTQVLSGTNSYTGNTSISAGTLNLTGSLSGGGAVATSGTGILSQGAASVISGASAVTQSSSGTSILAGSNSYSGLTTVNAGVLQVNHANALGSTTNGTTLNGSDGSVNFLGTVLDLNGVAIGSGESLNLASGTTANNRVTLRSMSGTTSSWAGGVVLSGDKIVQLQTGNATAQLAISGAVSSSSFAGTLNLRGAGTGTLSGGISLASTNNLQVLDGGTWNINTGNNTWGSTSLSNGVLVTGAANALPASQFITLGQSPNSGTLRLNGFDQTVGGLAVSGNGTANKIVNGSGTAAVLTVSHASANSTFSGILGGLGANENNFGLTKSGAATLTLNGTNTYTGSTLVTAGTLQLSGSGTLGSGNVTVSGGTLNLGTASITNTLGALTGGGAVNNGTITNNSGIYDVQSGSIGAILAGSNGLSKSTAGNVTLSGANSYSGNTTISAGTLALSGSGTFGTGTVTGSGGTIDLGGKSITNTVGALTGGAQIINGTFTNNSGTYDLQSGTMGTVLSGSNVLTKTGAGTVTLNAANTYTGNTTISAGTLALGASGSFANSPVINLGTAGSPGTLNLTAKGSAFSFGTSQTVSGYGTINIGTGNTVTINGTLAPGNSPGITEVIGNLTMAPTTVTNMEIISRTGAAGTAFDQVSVSGTLTFDGSLFINTDGLTGLVASDSFFLFSAGSYGAAGFDSVSISGTVYNPGALVNALGIWTVNDTVNNLTFTFTESTGYLSVTAIPEPSAYAALAGAGMIGLALYRRRRSRA